MNLLGRWRAQSPQRLYYGWMLVGTLGLTTIISYGTTQYLFGVLVAPLSQELGWTRASISGAYTGSVLLAGLLGVPIGRLVDRRGARLLMTCGSLLAGAALLGLASIQQLWQFYLLWGGGLGVATALTLYPVTFTVVANWFFKRRGAALALLTLVGGAGFPHLHSPGGVPDGSPGLARNPGGDGTHPVARRPAAACVAGPATPRRYGAVAGWRHSSAR